MARVQAGFHRVVSSHLVGRWLASPLVSSPDGKVDDLTMTGSWYLLTVIDRWIHYDQRFVQYGYILVPALFEGLRVGSGIILLWGTYTVVWKELVFCFFVVLLGLWWFV